MKTSGQDSTGKFIQVGDKVRWRGGIYTIKRFTDEKDPYLGTPVLEFEEPLHISGEKPCEFAVDRISQ